MGSEPVIIEISSDEEDCGLKESNATHCSEQIKLADGETAEEPDDVILLDEVPSTSGENFVSWRQRKRSLRDGFDDDCIVLDSDPDSIVSPIEDDRNTRDGSDELHIVGEKGQVACRDYPHSRHLCANLPFSSTPHAKHCKLCHCYVCDSPAPCIYWGNGTLSNDHCHSTDKELRWKVERRSFKKRSNKTLHSQGHPSVRSSMPPLHKPEPTRLVPPVITASTFGSHPLQPCLTTSLYNGNTIGQRQNQQLVGYSYGNQRLSNQQKKPRAVVPGAQAKTQWSAHGQHHSGKKMHGTHALATQTLQLTQFQRVGFSGVNVKGTSVCQNQKSVPSASWMQNTANQMYQGPVLASPEIRTNRWQGVQKGVASDLNVPARNIAVVHPSIVISKPLPGQVIPEVNPS